jgi:hypothetical protein
MEKLDISGDSQIFLLKEKCQRKKDEIASFGKTKWQTNCILEIMGKKYNLHIIGIEDCHFLLSLVLSLNESSKKSADLLGIEVPNSLCGFSYQSWIHDLISRGKALTNKETEKKIRDLEKRLDYLLSDDAKREIELKEISKILNFI